MTYLAAISLDWHFSGSAGASRQLPQKSRRLPCVPCHDLPKSQLVPVGSEPLLCQLQLLQKCSHTMLQICWATPCGGLANAPYGSVPPAITFNKSTILIGTEDLSSLQVRDCWNSREKTSRADADADSSASLIILGQKKCNTGPANINIDEGV